MLILGGRTMQIQSEPWLNRRTPVRPDSYRDAIPATESVVHVSGPRLACSLPKPLMETSEGALVRGS